MEALLFPIMHAKDIITGNPRITEFVRGKIIREAHPCRKGRVKDGAPSFACGIGRLRKG